MPELQTAPASDHWSEWLLKRRHGGDQKTEKTVQDSVNRIRDHVLQGAQLCENMVLADIGTGSGLMAFEAIRRIGPTLQVIFADVSVPLLMHCEAIAIDRGIRQQCTFVECSGDKLTGIADSSVDVVTTRAALAYVADKPAAFREIYRILKPGGRLSIGEPIFRDNAFENIVLREMLESKPPESFNRFLPLLHRWRATQFPDTTEKMAKDPLTNFCERDLFRFAAGAGFINMRMEFHVEVMPATMNSWEAYLGSSTHPLAPSLGTALANCFTPEESLLFEQTLRPIVEQQQSTSTERNVYVTGNKPLS